MPTEGTPSSGLLPNCGTALSLVKKGLDGRLTRLERIRLSYHARLCFHCECQRERFEQLRSRLRTRELQR